MIEVILVRVTVHVFILLLFILLAADGYDVDYLRIPVTDEKV